MRRGHCLAVGGLLGLVLAPFPQAPASASCAGPSLEDAQQLVLAPGAGATVSGRYFVDGCRDTGVCTSTFGCQKCEAQEPPEQPQQDIRLELRQRGTSWVVGTADAGTAEDGRLGRVTWTFEVPRDVEPGRARVVAGSASAVVRIAASR